MTFGFERKLPFVLTFVFFMLVTIGFVMYQGTLSVQDALAWQHRSHDFIGELDRVVEHTYRGEAMVRGFIVSGNDTYLERYAHSNRQVDQSVATIRDWAAVDQTETVRAADLAAAIERYRAQSAEKIAFRKQNAGEASYALFGEFESTEAGGQVLASVGRLKDRELEILRFKESNLNFGMRRTVLVLIGASIAAMLSLIIANVFIRRETRKRAAAESELREANQNLEERIRERTADLESANDNLRRIAVEREELLRNEQAARREAEVANRLRDEFMATVSHELRNPLNAILGWARLIDAGRLDDGQMTRALKTIVKSAETQDRLIEDLLDVARGVAGKLQLEMDDVRIGDVVAHSVEAARPTADQRGIELNLHAADGAADELVRGDRVRLRQVIGNLLTNALKFTPAGGKIDVGIRSVEGRVEVAVADNGVGISPEFLPMVFDRFRQDAATIASSGGLGLGLALVRQLTELHGGTVRAESDGKDRGARFTVSLPVAAARSGADERALSSAGR
ncbi:MAG: ATP-binding protein [Pyrinomonadaceae bacterium]